MKKATRSVIVVLAFGLFGVLMATSMRMPPGSPWIAVALLAGVVLWLAMRLDMGRDKQDPK